MRKGSNKSGNSKDSLKNANPPSPVSPLASDVAALETDAPEATFLGEAYEPNAFSGDNDNFAEYESYLKTGSEHEPPQMTKIQGSAHEGTGTSISSQIQKIIAKELMAPGNKRNVDLQSIPMKEYLEHTVLPIVHQGLMAVARERPDSPIEYMAAYFLKHKNKYQLSHEHEFEPSPPPAHPQQQTQPQQPAAPTVQQQQQQESPQPPSRRTTPTRLSADISQSQNTEVPTEN